MLLLWVIRDYELGVPLEEKEWDGKGTLISQQWPHAPSPRLEEVRRRCGTPEQVAAEEAAHRAWLGSAKGGRCGNKDSIVAVGLSRCAVLRAALRLGMCVRGLRWNVRARSVNRPRPCGTHARVFWRKEVPRGCRFCRGIHLGTAVRSL